MNPDIFTAAGSASSPGMALLAPPSRYLRGVVRDKDGNPAARTVQAFRRSDGALLRTVTSNATTGEYTLDLLHGDIEYDVRFKIATGETLNDLFFARATTSDT